jgi:hypothetical protein
LLDADIEHAVAGDDAQNVAVFSLDALPPLASDHGKIVGDAIKMWKKM